MERPVSCFGKLPFHREFLRVRLDSPAAGWVVRLVEGGHAALTQSDAPAADESPWVRFVVGVTNRLVIGVARRSSDGLRRHPIAVFFEEAVPALDAWPLLPLSLLESWRALATLVDGSPATVKEFTARLDGGAPPSDLAGAAATFHAFATLERPGPWHDLVGLDGDGLNHVAMNLLAVCQAQREARHESEGVSLAVPLPQEETAAAASAGVWVELLRAGVGRPDLTPALALTTDRPRLAAFLRPLTGADLAALLWNLEASPIDDLTEAWQAFPPSDAEVRARVDALCRVAPDSLAALSARLLRGPS